MDWPIFYSEVSRQPSRRRAILTNTIAVFSLALDLQAAPFMQPVLSPTSSLFVTDGQTITHMGQPGRESGFHGLAALVMVPEPQTVWIVGLLSTVGSTWTKRPREATSALTGPQQASSE